MWSTLALVARVGIRIRDNFPFHELVPFTRVPGAGARTGSPNRSPIVFVITRLVSVDGSNLALASRRAVKRCFRVGRLRHGMHRRLLAGGGAPAAEAQEAGERREVKEAAGA